MKAPAVATPLTQTRDDSRVDAFVDEQSHATDVESG